MLRSSINVHGNVLHLLYHQYLLSMRMETGVCETLAIVFSKKSTLSWIFQIGLFLLNNGQIKILFYLIICGIFHFQNTSHKVGAIPLLTTVLLFDRKNKTKMNCYCTANVLLTYTFLSRVKR